MVTLNTPIFREHVDLYLIGKKVRADEWAGIGASLWDPESVANITTRAMAFSEGLVSETNAIVVVLDRGIDPPVQSPCEGVHRASRRGRDRRKRTGTLHVFGRSARVSNQHYPVL